MSRPIQCESSPTRMSRRDSCGGTVHVAGCPADVSHGAVRVIEVEVIATAGSAGPRAGLGDALAATAGTSDSPWRDQRANDSGLRRLTQIGWDRTTTTQASMAARPETHSHLVSHFSARQAFEKCRGAKGIRTPDLLHAMQTRYQLRHSPLCTPLESLMEEAGPAPQWHSLAPASHRLGNDLMARHSGTAAPLLIDVDDTFMLLGDAVQLKSIVCGPRARPCPGVPALLAGWRDS